MCFYATKKVISLMKKGGFCSFFNNLVIQDHENVLFFQMFSYFTSHIDVVIAPGIGFNLFKLLAKLYLSCTVWCLDMYIHCEWLNTQHVKNYSLWDAGTLLPFAPWSMQSWVETAQCRERTVGRMEPRVVTTLLWPWSQLHLKCIAFWTA